MVVTGFFVLCRINDIAGGLIDVLGLVIMAHICIRGQIA